MYGISYNYQLVLAQVANLRHGGALIKGLFMGVSNAAGNQVSKVMPDAFTQAIGGQAAGIVIDGIQNGYEKNKPAGKVEKSNDLKLEIKTKQ